MTPAERERFLATSDRRDLEQRRLDEAYWFGYRVAAAEEYDRGYQQALDDQAAESETTRQLLLAAVHPVLDPEGDARRRIRAAEAGEKRDQAEHERRFVARAYNTPPHQRTAAQAATVQAYPPPGRKPSAA